MAKGRTFRWRWPALAATVVVAAIGISLGRWQLHRADEKRAIAQGMKVQGSLPPLLLDATTVQRNDPSALLYRSVSVSGQFVRDWPVYLDNRPHDGIAGFVVLMPLQLAGSRIHVLIARGWFPRDPIDRAHLPALVTPAGPVQLAGRVALDAGHVLQLGTPGPLRSGAIVQNAGPAEFSRDAGLAMANLLIEQTQEETRGGAPVHDGLVRDWPAPYLGIDRHLGYAFQWFALAATAIVFFVVTGFRRGTEHAHKRRDGTGPQAS